MAEKKLNTLIEILQYSANALKEKGIEDSRLNAELLMAEVLNCERIKLYLDFEKPLTTEEKENYKSKLKRRLSGEPLQYIIGNTVFFGYKISVDKNVLIPRPETEILTEYVLEEIKNSGKNNIKILEIGTGSGCIPIALSGELSKLNISHHIDSFDVSSGAIKLAKKNAEINKINILNINFTVENLFNSKRDEINYDYIISNPPYISTELFKDLPEDVKLYEPRVALTDEKDGLSFYAKIFDLINAKTNLKVFLEIAFNQKEFLMTLLGSYKIANYQILKDYSNLDRFLIIDL